MTLFLFPKIKPYVLDIIDNEYILNIILSVSIFVIVIFIILLINRSISKVIKYSGIGSLDKFFGFLFGFVRSYVIAVLIFTTINIVYNYDRWPINLDKSFSFEWVEKGSSFLIKEFQVKKNMKRLKRKLKIYNPKLKEECGVFGISNTKDASTLTALGLHALQHRGQEGCGIVFI